MVLATPLIEQNPSWPTVAINVQYFIYQLIQNFIQITF